MKTKIMLFSAFVVSGVFVMMAAIPASGQVAGPADMLVSPPVQFDSPALAQLKRARRLETPDVIRFNGSPALRFSYGTFVLLTRAELQAQTEAPSSTGLQETPPDEHHADVEVEDLVWTDFIGPRHLATTVKDQGQRGTCHAQAATALVEALYRKRAIAEHASCKDIDLSEQWLMYMYKRHSNNYADDPNYETSDGGYITKDLERIEQYGHVPELYWKYDPRHWSHMRQYHPFGGDSPRSKPWPWQFVVQTPNGEVPQACEEAVERRNADPRDLEDYRITNIRNSGGGSDGVEWIKDRLDNDQPVAIAVPWPSPRMMAKGCIMYVPDEASDMTAGEMWNDTNAAGESVWFAGGHAILVVGYGKDDTPAEDLFAIKNSWSRWWGDSGYGYFTKSWLTKCMSGAVTCDLASR